MIDKLTNIGRLGNGFSIDSNGVISVSGESLTFIGLSDTPSDYANHGGEFIGVKSDASGLEFVAINPGALRFKNVIDCSTNPNYPVAISGDTYKTSIAGKIGGESGATVEVGDIILCVTDAVAGDQATVGANWTIIQTNLDGSQLTTAYNHAISSHDYLASSGTAANSTLWGGKSLPSLSGQVGRVLGTLDGSSFTFINASGGSGAGNYGLTGTATITTGNSSVVVTHGWGATPDWIQTAPDVTISSVNSTTFTLSTAYAVAEDTAINWLVLGIISMNRTLSGGTFS